MATLTLNAPDLPHFLIDRLRDLALRRRADRDLTSAAERLAELSPHLLDDIGFPPVAPEPPTSACFGRT